MELYCAWSTILPHPSKNAFGEMGGPELIGVLTALPLSILLRPDDDDAPRSRLPVGYGRSVLPSAAECDFLR